jgi:class 3 adenylate cyclase
MVRISNQLPTPSADFLKPWIEEFSQELVKSALRRVRIVTTTLLTIEGLLLVSDFVRTRWVHEGLDAIFVWRIAVLVFLLTYRLILERTLPEWIRLRYFLIFGMALCGWASAMLAGIVGDISIFTIGALGVAAACPMPGRFNASLFVVFGGGLIGWLFFHFPNAELFWPSNIVATCVMGIVIEQFTFDAALREFSHRKGIERQRERSDELLYNVFPQSVAASLKEGQRSVALHGEVTILFADVVGFTELSSRLLPSQLLDVLEDIFGKFDQLALQHGVEKIKTIGDAYMAIAGAPVAIDHQVERMADFALDIVQACKAFSEGSGFDLAVRVGIHTGPVIAGVIGSSRLCYDLWGDSVNTAQRIESQGEPNAISVREPVYFKLRNLFVLEDRGLIDLKGKGPTRTFVLKGRRSMSGISTNNTV